MFDEISDAILIADDERKYVAVNSAACALLGRSREELLASRIDDVVPAPVGVDVSEQWRHFLAEGFQRGEFEIVSGTRRMVVEYRARARIAPHRHVSVLRDVTDRARALEAAEHRERAFRRLADQLPFVVARYDRHRRRTFVNYEPFDILSEDTQPWAAMLDRALAGEEISGELAIELQDGSVRTLETQLVPERDTAGAVESVLAVVRDVSEARKTHVELEARSRAADKSRAILDAFVMAAPVGFAYLDRDLRFVMVNPCLAAMNGLPVEAHLGKTPMELLPGLPADKITRVANVVFATGEPQTNIVVQGFTHAGRGEQRTWREHWYPVHVAGEITGAGVVVEDVTDKRRAEHQLRTQAELRERLMAIVSHDLKNPLSAIVTAATMIGMHAEAARPLVALASRIVSSGQRMARLVEQLIDFVRVDQATGLPMECTTMDLETIAERVAQESGFAFPKASIELRVEGNATGCWDEDRVAQVLSNLIGNAVEHGDGRVRVEVFGQARDSVHVEIRNGGTPIPPDMLPLIFEPFRRVATGLARRHGLGLGLFISKSIVEAHSGVLSVRSDAAGTVFSFTLPRTSAAPHDRSAGLSL